MEKIKIGNSDYTRKEMESGECGWTIGNSAREFIETIEAYEEQGYKIEFKTNIFQRIFGFGIYKVVATKNN